MMMMTSMSWVTCQWQMSWDPALWQWRRKRRKSYPRQSRPRRGFRKFWCTTQKKVPRRPGRLNRRLIHHYTVATLSIVLYLYYITRFKLVFLSFKLIKYITCSVHSCRLSRPQLQHIRWSGRPGQSGWYQYRARFPRRDTGNTRLIRLTWPCGTSGTPSSRSRSYGNRHNRSIFRCSSLRRSSCLLPPILYACTTAEDTAVCTTTCIFFIFSCDIV